MRSFIVVAGFAALFAISNTSSSNAASTSHKANASYASSNTANMSRAQQEPVPANCIRQECGKLWCWQMGGSKR